MKRVLLILITILYLLNVGGVQAQTAGTVTANIDMSYYVRQSSAPDIFDPSLQGILQKMTADLNGRWGVGVKKLDTGQVAFVGDRQFVSASLYKLGVLLTIAQMHADGEISRDDFYTVTDEDNYEEYTIDNGTRLSIQRAAELMIDESNNTASGFLVRIIGDNDIYAGAARINRTLARYGINNTRLDFNNDNVTTPGDMVRFFEKLFSSDLVNAEECRWMMDILLRQELNFLMPVRLPGVPIAHKTGTLTGLMHDAGIMYTPAGPIAVTIMAQGMDNEELAYDVAPKIARRIYDYFISRNTIIPRYFAETRHTVGGEFLKYWNTYGGLAQFGYPLSDEQTEAGLTVQYFERARFEFHPTDKSYPVKLTLLGVQSLAHRNIHPAPASDLAIDGNRYFPQTRHNLSRSFLSYWQENGGLPIYGLPISERFEEVNAADGKKYVVQYFERARFELHVDSKGENYVLLGALGSEALRAASPRTFAAQDEVERLFQRSLQVGSF